MMAGEARNGGAIGNPSAHEGNRGERGAQAVDDMTGKWNDGLTSAT